MIGTRCSWGVLALSLGGCALETSSVALEDGVATAPQELKRNALNAREQATVLKLIDDICGDTWCEGDHNFSFDRVECQRGCRGVKGICKLTFRTFSHDTDVATGPTFVRSCQTPGFSGFGSLVQTQGSYQSLQPDYYEALTECIAVVESELPQ